MASASPEPSDKIPSVDSDEKVLGRVKVWKREHGPRQIYYTIDVGIVSDISNIDQSFDVAFKMSFEWMASKEEKQKYQQSTKIEAAMEWKPPEVLFPTLIEHIKDPLSRIEVNMIGQMFCFRETRSFKCKLAEHMELQSFPFDVQDCTLPMIFPVSTEEVQFFPSLRAKDGQFITLQPQYTLAEWHIHPPMFEQQVEERHVINQSFVEASVLYTKVVVALKCERIWTSYFWRIFALSSLISLTLLALFLIDRDDIASRLSHGVTILLTMMAFQFVVQSYLPNLGYLTMLDWYLLGMDGYVVLVMMAGCISHVFEAWDIVPDYFEDGDELDKISIGLSIAILIIMQIILWIKIMVFTVPRELKKLKASQENLSELNRSVKSEKLGISNKFSKREGESMVYYGNINTQRKSKDVHPDYLKWAGIYEAHYGPHGIEYMYVFAEEVAEGQIQLLARKMTGDPNVPAGKITWKLEQVPNFKAEPSEDDKLIKGQGQVRDDINDPNAFQWTPLALESATENEIKIKWEEWDEVDSYRRYNQ